jgi:hypothetical protein
MEPLRESVALNISYPIEDDARGTLALIFSVSTLLTWPRKMVSGGWSSFKERVNTFKAT